jgi:hypothetical protein
VLVQPGAGLNGLKARIDTQGLDRAASSQCAATSSRRPSPLLPSKRAGDRFIALSCLFPETNTFQELVEVLTTIREITVAGIIHLILSWRDKGHTAVQPLACRTTGWAICVAEAYLPTSHTVVESPAARSFESKRRDEDQRLRVLEFSFEKLRVEVFYGIHVDTTSKISSYLSINPRGALGLCGAGHQPQCLNFNCSDAYCGQIY